MKRKIVVFTMVLALLIGATLFTASANPSNTDGSIEFKPGDVIIITPDDPCCPCFGDDPCEGGPCKHDPDCDEPCTCICHDDDDDYNEFFLDKGVENDLYFGNHNIREFGRFDSANTGLYSDNGLDTTDDGQYTGAEVRNFSGDEFRMGVSVGGFFVGPTPTLLGAELFLVTGDNQAPAAYPLQPGFAHLGSSTVPVAMTGADGNTHVLTIPSGNMVKASWSGLLDTLQGTATPGKAQAELTWTAFIAP